MPVTDPEIRAAVRQFVIDTFLLGDASHMHSDDESFLETGTIDSTGVLEVILFLETRFGIKIEDRELIPANIDSVDNQVRFVLAKLTPQAGNAA